ncbi:MAG: extradiol dioxygenase [Candidatus Nanopelagicales bacterium]
MITGAHVLLYSNDAQADRAFLRDVLGWPHVPAAGGEDSWLIFRLPPSEMAAHPTEHDPSIALYFMCDDLTDAVNQLSARGAVFEGPPEDKDWGLVTSLVLPSGARMGLYEPRHDTAVAAYDDVRRHVGELADRFAGYESLPGDEHDHA